MTRRRSDEAKRVSGTFRSDRAALVPALPGVGIGKPPGHLGADLAALWSELSAMVPKGVCGPNDAAGFEMLVRLTPRIRTNRFTAADVVQSRALMLDFGMLPNAPARLGLSAPEAPNKLQRFLDDAPLLRRKRGLSKFVG